MRVLITPDKFKGTLTAAQAIEALARGWHRARPGDFLNKLPMSDGGDGFGEIMGGLLKARRLRVNTVNAAQQPLQASWWWHSAKATAVIESANVIGLALLPTGRFHPFELDTFGLGAVLQHARKRGAKQCLMGIGGSATNDGGFGLARALGWRFLDAAARPIERWTDLTALVKIVPPEKRREALRVQVAVDVTNPLLGRFGATRVYGPQKGLKPGDFRLAEKALGRLALICREQSGLDFADVPGAGAAGGLGFGLMAFLGAKLTPGFELFSKHAGLKREVEQSDLVLTGEGAIDRSTLMGKGAGQVALLAKSCGVPCIGIAGHADLPGRTTGPFTAVHALTTVTSAAEAKGRAGYWLEEVAYGVAKDALPGGA